MDFTVDQLAHVVHEANRALQRVLGEQWVSPSWWEAPAEMRDSSMHGVRQVLAGATPEELHAEWVRWRTERGWRYGPVKDEWGRTHPCLVDYADLPPEQQVKDALMQAIVLALSVRVDSV